MTLGLRDSGKRESEDAMSDDLKTRVDKATCKYCADGWSLNHLMIHQNVSGDQECRDCTSAWPQVKDIFEAERLSLAERLEKMAGEWELNVEHSDDTYSQVGMVPDSFVIGSNNQELYCAAELRALAAELRGTPETVK